jgi:hypothetical protein
MGSSCRNSHNVFESFLHPQKYRTMMCKDRDKCSRPVCFFAHSPDEVRSSATAFVNSRRVAGQVAAAAAGWLLRLQDRSSQRVLVATDRNSSRPQALNALSGYTLTAADQVVLSLHVYVCSGALPVVALSGQADM